MSVNGQELRLEPNKKPYVVSSNGNSDLGNSPLLGSHINSMVFSLIPNDVKQELPNQSEVEFVHPHMLGKFKFLVKKSPSGFNVTVCPDGASSVSEAPSVSEQEAAPTVSSPVVEEVPSQTVNSVNESAEQTAQETPSGLDSFNFESNNAAPAEDASLDNLQSNMESQIPQIEQIEVESVETNSSFEQNTPSSENDPFQIDYEQDIQIEVEQEEPAVANSFEVSNLQTQAQDSQPEVIQASVPQVEMPVSEPTQTAEVSAPAQSNPQARSQMDTLFKKMAEIGASDLHLSVSVPPMVRKDGKMQALVEGQPALTPDMMKQLLTSIMPDKNIKEFDERNDTDFAYEIKGLARFRANIFMDRKGMGGVFRIIPSDIMTAEDLNLSKHIMELCELSKGLVVVTGPTGSGKSTTLCAMIDAINKRREDHIITIEDPIEFTHENQKCLVNQREVHNHTDSFKDALRAALREDPDILLVGEMRDLETISIAIETAETGHLVFGTLHTTTAASTVDRIIDQFPADRQQQVRVMLSESLRGVIAQTLLPKKGGGRIAALEVLIVTPAISNLIREGKTFQIPSAMQTGKNKGMVMLNDALMELVNKDLVEPKDAYIKAVDKTGFEMLLQRSGKRI